MTPPAEHPTEQTGLEFAEDVWDRLTSGKAVRRSLASGGALFLDGALPFLCAYRFPPHRTDAGTKELVTTEAAYLVGAGDEADEDAVHDLCRILSVRLSEEFDAFLLFEIWSSEDTPGRRTDIPRPQFTIWSSDDDISAPVDVLARELGRLSFAGSAPPSVRIASQHERRRAPAPPGLPPLIDELPDHVFALGLEVSPVYRSESGELYPALLRDIRAKLSSAVRRAIHCFVRTHTRLSPGHWHEMGARRLVKATGTFDERLSAVADGFDFLLQATPINADAAREEFLSGTRERAPALHYRPLPYQAEDLKRQLFEIPLDRVEDPSVAFLLEEKQIELDRQISALREIGTRDFLFSCLQIYGEPDDDLAQLADDLLNHVTPATGPDEGVCGADELIDRGRAEIARYRRQDPDFDPPIERRHDIASGILVSRGTLCVAESMSTPRRRIDALLQHEIGTHLVTHFNGGRQRLAQLQSGLAGYESLQEGLAVLAEILAGGVTPARVRTLAARVLAARWLIGGAEFVDVFRRLREADFSAVAAFGITLRVFRGGGFIKDFIYLQGFRDLVGHLAKGGDLALLFGGKFALHHIPFIEELRRRGVVSDPRLGPNFLEAPGAADRLASIREMTPRDILAGAAREIDQHTA